MAELMAFHGLRYCEEKAGELNTLVAPPYDIISKEEQDILYKKNPYNVIRLEYGKEEASDNLEENKYTRAKSYLDDFIKKGILEKEAKPSMYIYEQIFTLDDGQRKSFKGIITLVKLEEFDKQVIIPHEETLSKAKTDRFSLMQETHCNFSQIYCLYNDESGGIYNQICEMSRTEPQINFSTDDGILQRVWIADNEADISALKERFEKEKLFIADGHHRYETALAFRNKMIAENPNHTGNELYNYVMMFLVNMDNEGLLVFPTHRLINGLPSFSESELIKNLGEDFSVERLDGAEKAMEQMSQDKCIGLYTGGEYFYKIRLTNSGLMNSLLDNKSDAYKNLDVSILHSGILARYLGIDKENMANQKNLTYTRSFNEAIEGVKNGDYQLSFLLNSTTIGQIKDVTLNMEKMPQKSTYFWPKLTTGLVINQF